MNQTEKKEYDKVIKNALLPVVDPELGISIVDLGLLYGIDYNDDFKITTLNMTLTTAACPLTGQIEMQAQQALEGVVDGEVVINWVWEPAWTTDMITEEGKKQLSAIGFNF
ncbi:MAG: metal-sulfur cluster assembly factor [Candidatus Ancillula sp.]|jgi:metal-sulfur cluster biosynthetic enzyme|nr:metal-sulfur cluster assembly factor [Candidatus Ancillula sp.]